MYNNSAVARLLIGGGADPNALDEQEHETPLLRAAMNGGVDVAKVLIANGAAVNTKSGSDGDTPLHAASMDNRTEMVELLIRMGADISARNYRDKTPAQETGDRHIKELLGAKK